MGKQRRGPSQKTIKALFAVSGNRCAFGDPECGETLVDEPSGVVTGEVCHIRAESEGGPRYDSTQREKDRNGAKNLVLMCPRHHKIIDADERAYTVEVLCGWKQKHESSYRERAVAGPKLTEQMIRAIIEPLVAFLSELETPEQRRPRSKTELHLLNPYSQATDFIGRDDELKDLIAWATSQRPIAVRTIIGPGGAGKTRLALELMNKLRGRPGPAWDLGFLTPLAMVRVRERVDITQWKWVQPTLAVVDYAGSVAGELGRWVEALCVNPAMGAPQRGNAPPLRILLLDREASVETGWLHALLPASESRSRVFDLFDPPEPVSLCPIKIPEDRRKLLVNVLNLCAEIRGTTAPNLPEPGSDKRFDEQLEDPRWGDPLTLMMTSVVGIETGVPHALSLSRTDLAEKVASRQIQQIEKHASCAPAPEAAKRLTTLLGAGATLARGLTRDQAIRVGRAILGILDWEYPPGAGRLADDLGQMLSDGHGGIAPILPDMVGEAFVYLTFTGGTPPLEDEQRDRIIRATLELCPGAFKTLILLAQDYAERHGEVISWVEALIREGMSGDLGLLAKLSDELPHHTLALREKAAEVSAALVESFRKRAKEAPSERNLSLLGATLNNLGVRLSNLGRWEHALAAGKEARDIYRKLAVRRPDAFLGDLAMSVNNLAGCLSDLGRREEALEAASEAVGLYRKLAAHRPDAFLPDLATSLNNLGTILSEVGRREEALKAASEGLDIHRKLATQAPDSFLSHLGDSLNGLGCRLGELNRWEEALAATNEGTDIYRKLAAQRPDAYLPGLAMILETLCMCHGALGQYAKAKEVSEEGLRKLSPFFLRFPQAFARLTKALVEHYLCAVQARNEHPDTDLLGPIQGPLNNLGSGRYAR